MRYDAEYNSYKFSPEDLKIILNCLSFAQWNDKDISSRDSIHITNLYNFLEDSSVCSTN